MPPIDPRRRAIAIRNILQLRQAYTKLSEVAEMPVEAIILLQAIRLGELEGRPMDISTLSVVTGMKFPTTHRYLKLLRERGIIDVRQEGKRHFHFFRNQGQEYPEVSLIYQQIERAIREAAVGLSKLDNEKHLNIKAG